MQVTFGYQMQVIVLTYLPFFRQENIYYRMIPQDIG